jgi:nucleotide-binding universal stress UspA family protein
MSELAGGLIAVGVDGSPASVAALRWAADLAQLRDAEIVVVRAWHVALASLAPYAPVSRRPTQEGERRRAEADLAGAMLTVLGPAPDVKATAALVCGPPARVLLDQCADADLLVLGGHHADSPLRQTVGPIAAACLRQAPCPVVIVTVAAAWPGRGGGPRPRLFTSAGPGYRRRGLPGHCRSRGGRISRP